MGLQRSLSPGEIVGQVLRLRADQGQLERPVNIVFMGQGEPLDNVEAVTDAVHALQDPKGPALSWRRITVSTVGVVSALPRLAAMGDARPRIAVSLNATTDEVRSALMPINRKWPIGALLAALRAIPWRPRERVTLEYVLLADVNDGLEDARRLARLLRGLPAKVNLIPWNPLPAMPFRRPGPEAIERFRVAALEGGIDVLVRYSRGADIAAACGQLHAAETAAPGVEPGEMVRRGAKRT
jgi:23S rRNA (adenine2503-C2)-methyltransferase